VNGCLKGMVRLAGIALIVLALAVAWWFREPLLRTGSRWFGPKRTALPPVADTAVGAPTPAAVKSSGAKLSDLGKSGGPDSVVLSANEMASLIGAGIDWQVRKTFDSLRVELLDGSFAVHARLDTRAIPPDVLGPFGALVNEREPLRLAGPLVVEAPGRGRWTLQELSLRGFPFPGPMVQQIARRVAGADSTGAVPVPIPPDVIDIKIRSIGVVLYKRRRS
jgi:hypothetical protein